VREGDELDAGSGLILMATSVTRAATWVYATRRPSVVHEPLDRASFWSGLALSVFPQKAAMTGLPELPEFDSSKHKTMTFSRTVHCHYSFMPENLLDMNHQFRHRGIVGRLQPTLLGYDTGPQSVEARYLFTHVGGKNSRGAGLLARDGISGSLSSLGPPGGGRQCVSLVPATAHGAGQVQGPSASGRRRPDARSVAAIAERD
jgi:Vanillate O-demethylase oxygenase C-terminal domain